MKKRVFLAINLPKNIRDEMHNYSQNLARILGYKTPSRTPPNLPLERGGKMVERGRKEIGIKFVEKENLHITLHFLGDKTEQKIYEIIKIGGSAARNFSGFEIVINKLNAFPNINFPRIIVLGSEQESGVLQDLRGELGEGLEDIGIETDKRPWEGHITLARVKFGRIDFGRLLKQGVGELRWMADGFDLVESELTESGPIYKILKHFSFYEN